MKKRDIAAVLAFFSVFLMLLILSTKLGVNMNIIWIQSPELDVAGPQELEYKLLDWNKIVKSTSFSKNDKTAVDEKLFVSGLSEFQNINAFTYAKSPSRSVEASGRTDLNEGTLRNEAGKGNFEKDDVKVKVNAVKESSSESSEQEMNSSEKFESIKYADGDKSTDADRKTKKSCYVPKPEERFDCHPENIPTQAVCEARGCCWLPTKARLRPFHTGNPADPQAHVDVPYCYYPKDFPGYTVVSKEKTKFGFKTWLERNSSSYYPRDIKKLVMDVSYENDFVLHFKVRPLS